MKYSIHFACESYIKKKHDLNKSVIYREITQWVSPRWNNVFVRIALNVIYSDRGIASAGYRQTIAYTSCYCAIYTDVR